MCLWGATIICIGSGCGWCCGVKCGELIYSYNLTGFRWQSSSSKNSRVPESPGYVVLIFTSMHYYMRKNGDCEWGYLYAAWLLSSVLTCTPTTGQGSLEQHAHACCQEEEYFWLEGCFCLPNKHNPTLHKLKVIVSILRGFRISLAVNCDSIQWYSMFTFNVV